MPTRNQKRAAGSPRGGAVNTPTTSGGAPMRRAKPTVSTSIHDVIEELTVALEKVDVISPENDGRSLRVRQEAMELIRNAIDQLRSL